MKSYTVEMCYCFNVTVEVPDAKCKMDAINKAKDITQEEVRILYGGNVDCGELECEAVTYISDEKEDKQL